MWGGLQSFWSANSIAVLAPFRAWRCGARLYIITEWDRITTILLPEEY
jgi:hypothetical protein